MKVTIDIDFVSTTYPRAGYLLFVNKKLYQVTNVGEVFNNDKLLTCVSIYDNTKIKVFSSEVSSRFIKFIARHEKVTYSIIHGDYQAIIKLLKIQSETEVDGAGKPYNGNADELVEDILNKFIIVHASGSVTKIYSRLEDTDTLEITNIKLIDNFKLHDKSKRLATIKAVINKGPKSRYVLSLSNGTVIDAVRSDFKIIGKPNEKQLFTIK